MQGALLKDVSAEELAGIYTEVAEEIGIDNAYVLFNHFLLPTFLRFFYY